MMRNTAETRIQIRGNACSILRRMVVLCVLASVMGITSIFAAETGVSGLVVMGPVKPGPSVPGQIGEAPLRALFSVFQGDVEVAQFESDRAGEFEVALPPGDYTIVPNKNTPVPLAEKQTSRVTVPADGYVVITIRLETGMK